VRRPRKSGLFGERLFETFLRSWCSDAEHFSFCLLEHPEVFFFFFFVFGFFIAADGNFAVSEHEDAA
jgi:hypothetical protein